MAFTDLVTRDHTDALLGVLAATGKDIGDAQTPPDAALPYIVLYPMPGSTRSGPISDPNADAELLYQITCVGATREQAEWMRDAAAAAMNAAALVIPNRSVAYLFPVPGDGEVLRDDDLDPPLFYAVARWRLATTPT